MPEFDETDLRALIAAGKIIGLSLDTNIIDGLNRSGNLNHPNLRSVSKLNDKGVSFVLTDVAVGEITSHIEKLHQQKYDALLRNLKAYDRVWPANREYTDEVRNKISPENGVQQVAEDIVATFIKENGVQILDAEGNCSVKSLMESYFSNQPPFAGGDKKFEFPDAIALQTLETWSEENGVVLTVSNDKGWQKFCDESEYLYCSPKLTKALALFYENEGLVAKFFAEISEDESSHLLKPIRDVIQSDLDDMDFEVEAQAFMSFDYELEHAVINEIKLDVADIENQKILATDADTVTFAVLVIAEIEVASGFNFYVYDSIDRDNVGLGRTFETAIVSHRYLVSVIVAGKGTEEPETIEATIHPNTRLKGIDFGYLQPFSEPDYEPD